jgi:hypothetical protein
MEARFLCVGQLGAPATGISTAKGRVNPHLNSRDRGLFSCDWSEERISGIDFIVNKRDCWIALSLEDVLSNET